MAKLKDIPKIYRPREKFLEKGPSALTNIELLAIVLGSGIKGTNVMALSKKILKKFGNNFLKASVDDLKKISGIGQAKALQISAAIELNKRFSSKQNSSSAKQTPDIKFMDFCAGIGAGRLGLENVGMTCAAFSEIDKNAEKTYREFFGNQEKNHGDLMEIDPADLPDFQLMIAGFPCQSFSVMGQRKGMKDKRGQIIYGLINIMKGKNLPYFILENVKGLVNHEKGETLKIILEELDRAGYKVFPKVLSSLHHGVPQMRERIYFVGIRKDLVKANKHFEWPKPVKAPKLQNFLIDDSKLEFDERKREYETFLRFVNNKYNKGLFNIKNLLKKDFLVLDTRQSDLRLYNDKVPTLRTGRHGILYVKNGKFRKLSGLEALLLQGFPLEMAEKTKGKIADIHLLSQAGNAMTVSTIEAIGNNLLEYIQD